MQLLMSFSIQDLIINSLSNLSFQMVQAIQVLRFHLLELEKVSVNMNFCKRFKCANNPSKREHCEQHQIW